MILHDYLDLFSVLACPCQFYKWSIILNDEYFTDDKSNNSDIYKGYLFSLWVRWKMMVQKLSLPWDNGKAMTMGKHIACTQ